MASHTPKLNCFGPLIRIASLLLLLCGALPESVLGQFSPDASENPRSVRSSADWVAVDGGPETTCAFGTPYTFFFHSGRSSTKLLIYFQGGGACWNWVSCSGMFDTSVTPDELHDYGGIFDFSRRENPFRDYTILFIPYCTGDVHVGDAEVVYGEDVNERPVIHAGAQNVKAAVRWVASRIPEPEHVVVAGASAGSYGAIFHAPLIAQRFASSDMITIGDSGVPLLNDYEPILERWGAGSLLRAAWNARANAPLTLEMAYRQAAGAPKMRAVAQVTSDKDAIQSAFYLISGSPSCRSDSYALLDRLERRSEAIHSFIVSGDDHGLMRTSAFYEYEADNTLLVEWVRALVEGKPVGSVRCVHCSVE